METPTAMQIAIDKNKLCFVACMGQSLQKSTDTLIGEATTSRTYSVLTFQQLQTLYHNHTGYCYTGNDYNALLQACKYLAQMFLQASHERG
jgi:hypothetical protein